jgi:hypothetical protein
VLIANINDGIATNANKYKGIDNTRSSAKNIDKKFAITHKIINIIRPLSRTINLYLLRTNKSIKKYKKISGKTTISLSITLRYSVKLGKIFIIANAKNTIRVALEKYDVAITYKHNTKIKKKNNKKKIFTYSLGNSK